MTRTCSTTMLLRATRPFGEKRGMGMGKSMKKRVRRGELRS